MLQGKGVILIMACFVLFFCHQAVARQVNEPGEITAAVLRDFPPLYTLDKSGRPAGFAIDILRHVSDKAGYTVRYLIVENWSQAMEAVRSGEADLIPGIGISPVRRAEFAFTEEIETIPVSCFVRAKNFTITGIDSLGGHRVAVIGESAAQTRLRSRRDIELIAFPNIQTALFQLLAGDVDAFVFPEPVLKKKLMVAGLEERIKVVGKPLMELKRGFLLRKGETGLLDRLNPVIKEYTLSPSYLADYTQWYGKPTPFWTVKKIIWSMGTLLVVVVIVLTLWRYQAIMRLNRRLQKNIDDRIQAEKSLLASEARFRATFEQAAVGVGLVAPDGSWLKVNQRLCDILLYSEEEMYGLRFQDVTVADDLEKDMEMVARMLQGEIETYSRDKRYIRKDGNPVWVNMTKSLIRDAEGKPEYYIAIVEDISKRKLAEETLLRHQDHLEEQVAKRTEALKKMNDDLQQALDDIKTLEGILPLCSFCKRIKRENGEWEAIDTFIDKHSKADISHSVCPDCARIHYPGLRKN